MQRTIKRTEDSEDFSMLLQNVEQEQYLKAITRLLIEQNKEIKALKKNQEGLIFSFNNKIFLIEEVALLLKVCKKTVRELVKQQKIKRFPCFGKLHVTGQSILEFIKNEPKYYGAFDSIRDMGYSI